MIVEKLADDLKTTFRLSNGDSGMAWLAVARRAKELLGDKPVATREEVDHWLGQYADVPMLRGEEWDGLVQTVLAAIAYFAPPRTMIEGMTVDDLQKHLCCVHCCEEAHRLANTPAPVVDPDARAKAAAWAWAITLEPDPQLRPYSNKDDNWRVLSERHRNGWRAVAAMENK